MRILALLMGFLLSAPLWAHEMEGPRISVVLREPGHAGVTLYIDLIDLLHRQLAAQEPLDRFIVRNANRPLPELDKDLQRVGWQLVAAMQFAAGKQELKTIRWQLPPARQVQEVLQQQAMQRTIEPQKPLHPVTFEIHGELRTAPQLRDFTLHLAPLLQQALIVWYAPRQAWSSPSQPRVHLTFPDPAS